MACLPIFPKQRGGSAGRDPPRTDIGQTTQNVVGLSGGPGAGPFWPATLGSADTARARARVRSRQRCARTQARKGIGRPREPSGLAITTTITIARDQQQKVKAPKGEKSRIDTNCQSTPNPRAHSAEGVEGRRMVIGCPCGKRKPYAHNSFGGGRGGRTSWHTSLNYVTSDTKVSALHQHKTS